jgi:hypothetical protein
MFVRWKEYTGIVVACSCRGWERRISPGHGNRSPGRKPKENLLNPKHFCLFVCFISNQDEIHSLSWCAGLDTVLRCLLCRDEVPSNEWILFSHQLGPLARVSLAFFFVAVPVGAAIWDYYRLCWVRHRPPVPIVSWWGPHQWVNPLQPSIRSAGQSFFSLLLCCCNPKHELKPLTPYVRFALGISSQRASVASYS